MTIPKIMLGGVEIDAEAGPESQDVTRLGGSVVVRMSLGAAVKMTHWGKAAGGISGAGFLPAGLDGLDYSAPLELRLTKPRSRIQESPSFVLDAACRDDFEPWAFARVGGRWRQAVCVHDAGEVEVTPMVGADRYRVEWMPAYQVMADEPDTNMGGRHGWSIAWEQV